MNTDVRNFSARLVKNSDFMLFLIFLTVLIIGAIFVPAMLQEINITNVIRNAAIVGIVATGATFVLLTGEVDMSVGSILSITAVIGGILLNKGISPALALLISLVLGGILGFLNGVLVSKGKITSLMVTLGLSMVYAGIANILVRGQAAYLYGVDLYQWLCKGFILRIPVPTWLFLLITVFFTFIMNNMTIGRQVYFVGANIKAAEYSGIKSDKIKILMFVICGVCAALTGPILSAQTNRIIPTLGSGYELSAIAIAVLGGTPLEGGRGSILGTFIGAMIYTFLLNILTLSGIGTYMEGVLKGLLLIAIVAVFSRTRLNRE
jgi:ribose/xylose/arabinose/galactoside ABC-type transport system permease subunit